MMPIRFYQLLLISIGLSLQLSAALAQVQPLCPSPTVKKQSDGAMPIPETAFTEQAAKQEIKKLNKLFGPDGLSADSVAWETSFVMIEGWYLKRQALEAKKRGEIPVSSSEFCSFMKDRAFVRH